MKNNTLAYSLAVVLFFLLICQVTLGQSVKTLSASEAPDSTKYAKTPGAYEPYQRFEDPYKRFFLDTLEYPGYGRQLAEPQNIDTVKIGFIGPIISPVADPIGDLKKFELKVNERVTRWDGYQASYLAPLGNKMLQGALLAVEHANKRGGYRGRLPYKLIIRNDNGNWRSSGRESIMLAYKDRVWAIIGTIDGASSHIAIRAALKAEIPVMNTADTDPTFVETSIPWVFRCITDDRQMCYLLADLAFKKLKLRRVAAIRASNRYGRVSIGEFRDAATRLGYPFVIELQYEEGDTDFSRQLERIRMLRADGIITYGNSRESALILKQIRAMGMKQWFFGSDRMLTSEFIEIVGNKAGNLAAAYPYNPESTEALYLSFIKEFESRFGVSPETYAAHAYDGTSMVIEAIEKAGLNRALIRDEIARMTAYHGVTGKKEFDAVLSNRSPAFIAFMKSGKFEFYSRDEIFSEKFYLNK